MKKILFAFLGVVTPIIMIGQNLSGRWTGGLPQNDKTFVFKMEVEMSQNGEEISGKAKYIEPISDSYVVEKFIGSVKGNTITINEYEVLESRLTQKANFTAWCLKTMIGDIRIDKAQNKITIEGTWSSNRIWHVSTEKYSQGRCAPGRFIISKEYEDVSQISGVVYDRETLKGIKAKITLQGKNGAEYYETNRSGYYTIEIASNSNYRMTIDSDGFNRQQKNVYIDNDDHTQNFFLERLEAENNKSSIHQIPMNRKVRLDHVLFEQSKSKILSESFSELNIVYRFLDENPNTRIRIEGHTDKIGDSNKNLILSKERANAIKAYLVDKGISSDRIETIGYGDKVNICKPECKENRRVEFIITRK